VIATVRSDSEELKTLQERFPGSLEIKIVDVVDVASVRTLRDRLSVAHNTAKAPGQSSYSAATLVGGSMWDTAAIPAGSRKAVLKKFENVSESGSKRQ
jgi:hypothetical protein